VHNNYYFLRSLANSLEVRLKGFTLVSCFSQDKDELVMEFNDARESFFIKASLGPDLQCLSFPSTFHRARKNSIDLFPEILMKTVVGLRPFANERSLGLQLSEGWMLVFKMHGKQSNVLLAQGDQVTELFRNNFPSDRALRLSDLDREINWDTKDLSDNAEEWEKRFITFGKPVWTYLNTKGFAEKSAAEKAKLLDQVKSMLEKPAYYLADTGKSWQLSLLPVPGVVQQFKDPIEAVNVFFQRYHSRHTFEQEKAAVLSSLRGRIRQCKTFTDNAARRLSELSGDSHYTRWADLIMANLHRIQPGATEVMLDDFHEPGRQVAVKLRKELSPQKNAEIYYRKAKNQSIERNNVSQALTKKEAELSDLLHREAAVVASTDRESLKAEARTLTSQVKEKEKRESMPYRSYTISGFTILVGKNAAANDELTLHHTHKEDLWLHARDVAGSHVVIRHQSGKTFPKDVIELAASLAAWYSRRKNESLGPVSVTTAKYVRKRKGDPPGMVVLQQEKVIMVPPRAPEDLLRSS
jgi:predicted ribosome quality control (RQC) complex YloA/Tae2 family protein